MEQVLKQTEFLCLEVVCGKMGRFGKRGGKSQCFVSCSHF
nr:MAG TPA: hypothetical protein [Bacteriophage sp.]